MNKEELLKFKEGLEDLNITLTDRQYEQFEMFFDMLLEKNKVMNLTAITDGIEVVQKHFVDSLAIVKAKDMSEVTSVIDVGTGAGFPGIPLKIAFPHLEMVLVDSLEKRLRFLNEVIEALGLQKIRCVHGRAEDLARTELREHFDLCVSRAVANLTTLSEYCVPFVKPDKGNFISYKAGDVKEELEHAGKAVHVLGGKIKQEVAFMLPDSDISRTFVCIEKEKRTPKAYPRKAGIPSRNPIA